jgi:hypothetical protein
MLAVRVQSRQYPQVHRLSNTICERKARGARLVEQSREDAVRSLPFTVVCPSLRLQKVLSELNDNILFFK